MDIVIGIILIVSALFLVVAVLLQSGKDKAVSYTHLTLPTNSLV